MKKKLPKGCVHIYTGNGKGKTTAAIGLAIRAAGAGLKTFMFQFVKGMAYNEIKILRKIKNIKLIQCGRGCFIKGRSEYIDKLYAKAGLDKAVKSLKSGRYDLVILDEINIALSLGLIKSEDVVDMINKRPRNVELVLTGRNCPRTLLRYADIVTEMREVKHPYKKGVKARCGIEY